MQRKTLVRIATATAVLTALGTAVYAQDKYALTSPSGIAFADFRGYEDWAVVSSARTEEVLKVIVANPAMIEAYKAGVPGNGQPFPEGSKIVKLQWKPKQSTEAPFAVDVPDVFTQASSSRRTASDFRTPAAGDTPCSTLTPRPARLQPTRLPPTAGTPAMWRCRARTTSSIRTRRGNARFERRSL